MDIDPYIRKAHEGEHGRNNEIIYNVVSRKVIFIPVTENDFQTSIEKINQVSRNCKIIFLEVMIDYDRIFFFFVIHQKIS